MSSSIRIKDIADIIENFCPIRIYVNGKCIFDDDKVTQPIAVDKEYAKSRELLKSEAYVDSIKFDICDFHHSIVYIQADYYDKTCGAGT